MTVHRAYHQGDDLLGHADASTMIMYERVTLRYAEGQYHQVEDCLEVRPSAYSMRISLRGWCRGGHPHCHDDVIARHDDPRHRGQPLPVPCGTTACYVPLPTSTTIVTTGSRWLSSGLPLTGCKHWWLVDHGILCIVIMELSMEDMYPEGPSPTSIIVMTREQRISIPSLPAGLRGLGRAPAPRQQRDHDRHHRDHHPCHTA